MSLGTARFDCITSTRNGWQEDVAEETVQRRGRRGQTAP